MSDITTLPPEELTGAEEQVPVPEPETDPDDIMADTEDGEG